MEHFRHAKVDKQKNSKGFRTRGDDGEYEWLPGMQVPRLPKPAHRQASYLKPVQSSSLL